MIQLKTLLNVIDNSGARIVECIQVLGGGKVASLGDEVVCVVKKAKPLVQGIGNTGAATNANRLKKGDIRRAVVVRTAKEVRRRDGSYIRFDDNAVVMLNSKGEPLGNRVLGVIAEEVRQKRWAKIASLAPKSI